MVFFFLESLRCSLFNQCIHVATEYNRPDATSVSTNIAVDRKIISSRMELAFW